MKYKKCPRCELNYVLENEEMCVVCRNELNNVPSIFINLQEVCPFCGINIINSSQDMCDKCKALQEKNQL